MMKDIVTLVLLSALICVVHSKAGCRTRYGTRVPVMNKCLYFYVNKRPVIENKCYQQDGRLVIINNPAEAEAFIKLAEYELRRDKPQGLWLAYTKNHHWSAGNKKIKIDPEAPFAEPPGKERQCNMLNFQTGLIENVDCNSRIPMYCEEIEEQTEEETVDDDEISDDDADIADDAADIADDVEDNEPEESTPSKKECCSCCKRKK